MLGERRRADREVAGQPVDRAAQPLGHEQPAQPPAGHREVLGEGVDDDRLARGRPGADVAGAPGVGDAVVDLVADQPDPGARAVGRQRGQLVRRQHGAGRVGRAGDDQPVDGRRAPRASRRWAGSGSPGRTAARRPRSPARAGCCGSRGSRGGPSPTRSPTSNAARKASRKPPDEPVVTTTSSAVDRQAVGVAVVRGDRRPAARAARARRCSRGRRAPARRRPPRGRAGARAWRAGRRRG